MHPQGNARHPQSDNRTLTAVSQTFGDPTGTAAVPPDDNRYAVSCGMRCDVANGQQCQPLVEPADGSGAVVNDPPREGALAANLANGILFKARVCCCRPGGSIAATAGAPSVLVSYDPRSTRRNYNCWKRCTLAGQFLAIRWEGCCGQGHAPGGGQRPGRRPVTPPGNRILQTGQLPALVPGHAPGYNPQTGLPVRAGGA
jgi:hypothetical protein